MKDWRGVTIEVGDLIVYPVSSGSSLYVVEAEVTEIIEGPPLRWKPEVPTYTIKAVQTGLGAPQWGVARAGRTKVTIHVTERVTVVKKASTGTAP